MEYTYERTNFINQCEVPSPSHLEIVSLTDASSFRACVRVLYEPCVDAQRYRTVFLLPFFLNIN